VVFSTNKIDNQDITEILLKVALNTINQPTKTIKYIVNTINQPTNHKVALNTINQPTTK
jgi:hypothetical protein